MPASRKNACHRWDGNCIITPARLAAGRPRTCLNLGVLLALTTGMRIGELCALQWQDINVKHGVVDVYKTLSTILGHSSVSVTMNFYVHPDNNQKKKCIENMLGHVLPKT